MYKLDFGSYRTIRDADYTQVHVIEHVGYV